MPDIQRKHLSCAFTVTLILLGMFQCGYAIAQLLGICMSHNPDYAFTGSFYNPGPLACYLAVCLPVAIRMMLCGNKFQKPAGMGMAILAVLLIPVTMSRTAIIAGSIGGIVATSDKWSLKQLGKAKLLVIGAICMTIAGGIYMVKKNSADGRLLMWKVATQAAMEVPLTGAGWSNVAGSYGDAQEKYFASGKGSEQEIIVADAPEYVFNEYLQIAIAYGQAAAVIIVVLTAGGVVTAIRNKAYGFAGSTAAVATVMFASYPLQFPLFVITIALILTGAWMSSSSRATGLTATAIITVLTCLFLTHRDAGDTRTDFAVAHSLHRTHNYRRSNDLLLGMCPHSSDPMILNIIAKNYRALCQPDSAEYYLKKSINRCPNRLYPHYLLMQLYGDSSYYDPIRQCQEAEHILSAPVKIPSQAVEEMREEAKLILKRYK